MNFCAGAEEVVGFSKTYGNKQFLCRIHEEEGPIFDSGSNRSGTIKWTKSADFDTVYKNNDKGIEFDMLQYTMRASTQFKTKFDQESIENYSSFPFDKNISEYRFELSHFEM